MSTKIEIHFTSGKSIVVDWGDGMDSVSDEMRDFDLTLLEDGYNSVIIHWENVTHVCKFSE